MRNAHVHVRTQKTCTVLRHTHQTFDVLILFAVFQEQSKGRCVGFDYDKFNADGLNATVVTRKDTLMSLERLKRCIHT